MSKAVDHDPQGLPARLKPRGQKADLFRWVNDQQQLDMRTKFILKELASFADSDCCAWSKVDDLAYAANCSARTVQYHLSALLEAKLIKPSGRVHRLDNSTRSVPIYQLAPGVEGLGAPIGALAGMGAKIAPIEPEAWVQAEPGMGATGLHPQMENREQSGDKSPSPSAREREARLRQQFAALEAATPKAVLKFADPDLAFAAFCELEAGGEDVAALADCARRMAADPAFKSRKFPPPLETWLAKRQFRGWLAEAVETPAAGAVRVCAVPAEVLEVFGGVIRASEAESYLRPCGFEAGPPGRLIARTGVARDWLERAIRGSAALRALGLVVEVQGRA